MRIIVSFLLLVAVSAGSASSQELPPPLLELKFDAGFANSGALGGEAAVKIYAEGEGPYLMPGPWGDCLDMTSASRFGGTIEQKTLAGSAVFFSNPVIDGLSSLTVSCWIKAAEPQRDAASRLLTKPGAWEVMFARGTPGLVVVAGDEKPAYRPSFLKKVSVGDWTFFAVSADQARHTVRYYLGNTTDGLSASEPAELTHTLLCCEMPLEIGNYSGIRPFKGMMDNLRIFDTALSEEEVKRLFDADLSNRGQGRRIYDLGVPYVRNREFHPKPSDIMFSMRWQRKDRSEFEAIRDFHATHCLWVYGTKADYVGEVKALGLFYQGSLNGLFGCDKAAPEPSAAGDVTGRQQDLDGNKIVPPHMVHWKGRPRWTGCSNSPDFRKLFWEGAEQLVSIGVDAIHVDDWTMSAGGAEGGRGCFCPACMNGFREYLGKTLSPEDLRKLGIDDIACFDYREFLRNNLGIKDAEEYRKKFRELPITPHFLDFQYLGLRDFYASLRKHLDTISPNKYIPVSVNNQFRRRTPEGGFGAGGYCVDVLDFFIGEPSQSMQTALDFLHPCKVSEAFGIAQITWNKPQRLAPALASHALVYALGQWSRVPWDLYMDNDPITKQPAPRYFATKEDWGALYDFIHEHPQLFDGYETAATVGVLFNLDAEPYGPTQEICRRLMEIQAPFRLIPAACKLNRIPVDGDLLARFSVVINVSPAESYSKDDQQAISAVRDSRRTRFLSAEEDIEGILRAYRLLPVSVEGPDGIYAFLRVKADGAVVHLINWNARPDGSGPDTFANVTLSLDSPPQWGDAPAIKYYCVGQKGGVDLNAESHQDILRITLPRLDTWDVVEIKPKGIEL